MRQVLPHSLLAKAHQVVVTECRNRATRRHRWGHGGRFETRYDADQVAEQNEQKKSAEERQILQSRVAHGGFRLAAHKIMDELEGVLQLSGPVHRKPDRKSVV